MYDNITLYLYICMGIWYLRERPWHAQVREARCQGDVVQARSLKIPFTIAAHKML